MIFKKKEFFLLIFLMFLQSCSGGRIGNFFESSFNDLEKTSQNEALQNNLINKKILLKENKENDDKKNNKINKRENSISLLENKKDTNLEKENKENDDKKNNKINKRENSISLPENKKDTNLEKENKENDDKKNKKIKNYAKKRETELQSYKIIFILKNVDPKDPTKDLSTILSNSEVNFEIEKIERILDSKNKSMNKN